MSRYEQVTFGNRGNTAAFIVMVAPVLLTVLIDRRRPRWLRTLSAITLTAILLNMIILQVRAAFIALTIAVAVVWVFKFGFRHLPVFALCFAAFLALTFRFSPDLTVMVNDHLLPAVTLDTEGDASVGERVAAIREGWRLAQENWLLGIGPGAGLALHSHDSAHQFHVQQAMELGMLGLFASTLFTAAILASLIQTLRRRREETSRMRFLLLIGPCAYLVYAILANATLGYGTVNTWIVLMTSMLALMPARKPRVRVAVRSAVIVPVHLNPELCS
jgi:uncharacterized protein with PQ loop repeat